MTSSRPQVTLPTDEQILVTCEFDVPKRLLYRAWTTPDLLRRWWPGGRGEMTVAEIDLRVGGAWRYVMVTVEGAEVAFHGEYRVIVPDERLVYSEVFEDRAAVEAQTTVTFSEADGRTTLAILVQYGSTEERDAHVGYMGDGMRDALGLLEQTVRFEHVAGRKESSCER